jgi:Legionella pneumophila major outer membrane protein precursor
MRMGRLWIGAGVGLALLLSINGLRAQERIAAPAAPMPSAGPPPVIQEGPPPGMVNGHGEYGGAHVQEGDWHHDHGCVEDGIKEPEPGYFATFDYLLVRPRRQALDFAIVDPTLDNAVNGNVSSAIWNTNSAYRLTAGYRLRSGMDFAATYFYLHSKDNRNIVAPPGGALYATLTAPFADQVDSANVGTNLDMDVIDVVLGQRMCVNDHLNVRLAVGTRIAAINQKLSAFYSGSTAGTGTFISSPINFDGIGLVAGGQAFWNVFRGVGVYAKANMALMTGDFRTSLIQTANGGSTTVVGVGDKFTRVVPVSELGLGLSWQTENIRFSFGYEIANYFNMVDSLDFVESSSFGKIGRRSSDLSYDGLVVSLGLFF